MMTEMMVKHRIRDTVTAFAFAALAFVSLQTLFGHYGSRAAAAYSLGGIAPASEAQAKEVRDSMLRHLRSAGMHRPGSSRKIEIDVVLEADDPVNGNRPMRVKWIVYDGGKRLGSVVQVNDIPAEMDPWHAIAVAATPSAVKGIKKLVSMKVSD